MTFFGPKTAFSKPAGFSSFLVRLVLFIYDCLRLVFLLALITRKPDADLPVMVYAAPNALFPLMAFFLLLRPGESRAFAPLYTSGKIIAVAALSTWIALGRETLPPPWSFFLGVADMASAAGAVLAKAAESPAAEQPIEEGEE